jgi:AraC family transcriptional regulator, regulatory protein of adaptative response / methylated-DNA-[protein]-cysteine methyltransferase
MFKTRANSILDNTGSAKVLIPLIRTAATIGFAVAPCSLGFVIIAVSEQLIRSIMVGDDPEMLVSDLQNQFPNDAIAAVPPDPGLVAKVVGLIERPEEHLELGLDVGGADFQALVWDALHKVPSGRSVSYTFLAEQFSAGL